MAAVAYKIYKGFHCFWRFSRDILATGGDGRKVVLELCEGVLSERDS